MPDWTPEQLAQELRDRGTDTSRWTIRRACERGDIFGAYRTAGGHWRIPHATAVAMLALGVR